MFLRVPLTKYRVWQRLRAPGSKPGLAPEPRGLLATPPGPYKLKLFREKTTHRKKTLVCCCWLCGVWGGLEVRKVRRKMIRVDWAEFRRILSRETPENHPNTFFLFLALLTRLRSFFFVPWSLSSLFLKNPKRCAPENDRHPSFQKNIWGHGVPFGNKSDASCLS